MINFGPPRQINTLQEQYAASDLVSLAWLQKGDILQITPLDNEDNFLGDRKLSSKNNSDMCIKHSSGIRGHYSGFSNAITGRISLPPISSPVITTSYVNSVYANAYGQSLVKPCYSYTHLIFMAIESSPSKCMTVNQIYNWCETNFPFYKHAGPGWKNSLRHNLSINKSFKRLPRDGRADNLQSVGNSVPRIFGQTPVLFDETNSTEGPGRGAYWAVEPRERPNLLDAVKRNPWNLGEKSISQPMSVNPIQSCAAVNSDTSRVDFKVFSSENNLRSGRSTNLIISSSHCGISSPFNLMETSKSPVKHNSVTPCHISISELSQSNVAATMAQNCLTFQNSENENPVLEKWSPQNSHTFERWSAEEEEKYREMMRLLIEGCAPDESIGTAAAQLDVTTNSATYCDKVKSKKESRQRRKSSLYPTDESTCNECKENASSTFRSCSLSLGYRRYQSADKILPLVSSGDATHLLSNQNKFNPYTSDSALDQLLEALDDDQEIPTANNRKLLPPISVDGEIFITPAPYHDHEYSHCQPQIRRPVETRIVELVNARLKQERLHFLHGLANSDTKFTFNGEAFHLEEDFEQPVETEEQDYYEDVDSCQPSPHAFSNPLKRLTYRDSGGFQKLRVKAGEVGQSAAKISRRSSRSIRAPKRSYEDFSKKVYDVVACADDRTYSEVDFVHPPPYIKRYQRRANSTHRSLKRRTAAANKEGQGKATNSDKKFSRRPPFNAPAYKSDLGTTNAEKLQIPPLSIPLSTIRKQRSIDVHRSRRGRRLKEKLNASEVLSSVDENQIQPELNGQFAEECSIGTVKAATEAAQILMGINQMKNFKLQSGYLSLDSSEESAQSPDSY